MSPSPHPAPAKRYPCRHGREFSVKCSGERFFARPQTAESELFARNPDRHQKGRRVSKNSNTRLENFQWLLPSQPEVKHDVRFGLSRFQKGGACNESCDRVQTSRIFQRTPRPR